MKVAKNLAGELCYAGFIKQDERSNQYFCLQCGQYVQYRQGSRSESAYFTHKKNKSGKGETDIHQTGKQWLEQAFITSGYQVSVEQYLDKLKQRPDILLTRNTSELALEYQCSPLSFTDYSQRTNGYLTSERSVVWVLGERYHNLKRVTKSHRMFFSKMKNEGIGLYFLLKDPTTLQQFTSFSIVDGYAHPFYQQYQWQFTNVGISRKIVKSIDTIKPECSLIKQVTGFENQIYSQNIVPYLRTSAYQAHHNLMGFPYVCYELKPYSPIFNAPLWQINIQLLLVLEKIPKFDYDFYVSVLKQHLHHQLSITIDTDSLVCSIGERFIQRLLIIGYLEIEDSHIYRWLKLPKWYADLAHKKRYLQAYKKLILNKD